MTAKKLLIGYNFTNSFAANLSSRFLVVTLIAPAPFIITFDTDLLNFIKLRMQANGWVEMNIS